MLKTQIVKSEKSCKGISVMYFQQLGNSRRCCIGFSLLEINHTVVTGRVCSALAGMNSFLEQQKYKGAEILLNKLTAGAQ